MCLQKGEKKRGLVIVWHVRVARAGAGQRRPAGEGTIGGGSEQCEFDASEGRARLERGSDEREKTKKRRATEKKKAELQERQELRELQELRKKREKGN